MGNYESIFAISLAQRLGALAREEGPLFAYLWAMALLLRGIPKLRSPSGLATLGALAILIRPFPETLSIYTFSALVYAWLHVTDALARESRAIRWRMSLFGILVLCALFAASRRLTELHPAGGPITLVLDMLLFLRLTSLVWDYGSRRCERPSVKCIVAWITLPFTRFGPILRYPALVAQVRPFEACSPPSVPFAFNRTILGLAKIGAAQVLITAQSCIFPAGVAGQLLTFYGSSPWSWYLSAAGSCDVAIATGLLCGFRIPENYDNPFSARNLGDFWARWNMTCTAFFRESLFYSRYGLRVANPYVNSIILFSLVGLWHGFNGYWVIFGLLHGIGFSVFIWYKRFRREMPGPIAWALTYIFVCSCWILPPQLLRLGSLLMV